MNNNEWLATVPPKPIGMHARILNNLKPMIGRPFTEEDRKRTPITVNNRVFRVKLDRRTTFMDMMRTMITHRRREVKFPQIRVSFGHAESNEIAAVMTYTKGKFVVCGTRSLPTAVRAVQMLRLSLQQCGIAIGLMDVTSVNAVVNAHMPFNINIDRAVASRELASVAHRKKDFVGAVFRVRGVEVLAFHNGGCVLTGAPDVVEMELVRSIATEVLSKFAVPKDKPLPPRTPSDPSARPARSILKRGTGTKKAAAKKKNADNAEPGKRETFANRRRRERREATRVEIAPVGESRARGRTKGVAFQLNAEMTRMPGEDESVGRKRSLAAASAVAPAQKKPVGRKRSLATTDGATPAEKKPANPDARKRNTKPRMSKSKTKD